jgi:hypothetical protein
MDKQINASNIYDLGVWLGYLEGILGAEKIIWRDVRETLQNLATYKSVESLEFVGNEAQSEFLRLAHIYKYSYNMV